MGDITPNPNVEALFLRHMAAVRGFVFGMLADRSAVDDVLQEVFVVVKERAADFRPNANYLAWVRGIARNKVFEYSRRRRSPPLIFDAALLHLLAEAAELRDEIGERRREALAKCLDRLAPRAREIVDLRYAEQSLSPPEIADRLGWSANAVHVALARARAFLRDCTSRMLAGGET